MKIVQTFWTANKSLLENSFGWYNSQYHLMSWALSCLSLKKYYVDVVLYTDSHGYKVFIELLQLPYTDVIVQYDNLLCPEIHWAYPKIVTYSLQNEPFIHVDGDVYLPFRLDTSVELGELIAQNKEIGSEYYKGMMNDLLRRNYQMPKFLKAAIERDIIPSYNAGLLGGNDIAFIQEYCQVAFQFVEDNHLNDINNTNVNINNNILFEQVLFATLVEKLGKTVSTVVERSVRDNGYDYHNFCDFYLFDYTKLLHILGGHKRNLRICELLAKTLIDRYPDYYKRIVELFPQNNKRLGNTRFTPPDMSVQKCLAYYQDFLCDQIAKWKELSNNNLYALEKRLAVYPRFMNASVEKRKKIIIAKNPNISIFEIPKHWPPMAMRLLKERINGQLNNSTSDIVCLPILLGEGFKEILISDLSFNIITLLEEKKTFDSLFNELQPCFSSEIAKDKQGIYSSVLTELEYLFYNGVLYVEDILNQM